MGLRLVSSLLVSVSCLPRTFVSRQAASELGDEFLSWAFLMRAVSFLPMNERHLAALTSTRVLFHS